MAWQHISPEVNVKGFNRCCICNALDWADDDRWNGSERDENVRNECVEDEDINCEGDRDLTGKGGYNLTCFVYIV